MSPFFSIISIIILGVAFPSAFKLCPFIHFFPFFLSLSSFLYIVLRTQPLRKDIILTTRLRTPIRQSFGVLSGLASRLVHRFKPLNPITRRLHTPSQKFPISLIMKVTKPFRVDRSCTCRHTTLPKYLNFHVKLIHSRHKMSFLCTKKCCFVKLLSIGRIAL